MAKQDVTVKELARVFARSPERKFGSQSTRGYFMSELTDIGVTKGTIKKLLRTGLIIEVMFQEFGKGSALRFYCLAGFNPIKPVVLSKWERIKIWFLKSLLFRR